LGHSEVNSGFRLQGASLLIRTNLTLALVAEVAGVSLKTASRVVRKEPNFREETRRRVENAMHEVNYRPGVALRASVGAGPFLIGLVFVNPNSSYIVDLLRRGNRATDQPRAEGYNLVIAPIHADDSNIGEIIKTADNLVQPSRHFVSITHF
jgi:LacI family transcriptional regulator